MTLGNRRANGMTSSTPHIRNLIAILELVFAAAALAGCSTQSAHTRAAAQCWMSAEKGRASMDLDKRADIASKCIDDKMMAAGVLAR
jgi:hypothetical protein